MKTTQIKPEIFSIKSNDVEGRLDCFFYQPVFFDLDRKVRKITKKTLGDYALGVSSGATPNKSDYEKYYSDRENGIPFLRVQNLSERGELKIDDVIYINKKTHNGILKRSQVKGGDLLIKITGVGRMAIASVVPKDFVGNINQHIVVIKTENEKISRFLATYLNSDIVEKLASKRSTGGTRPALDYTALLSIPIIESKGIVDLMNDVYNLEKENEQKARELVGSIDDYVLDELGIKIPEIEDEITFVVKSNELENNRIDTEYHQEKYKIIQKSLESGKYDIKKIKELSNLTTGAIVNTKDYLDNGVPLIRIQNIDEKIILKNLKYISEDIFKKNKQARLQSGDLVFGMSGTIGNVAIVQDNIKKCLLNQRVAILRNIKLDKYYLKIFLNNIISKIQFERIGTGGIQINISNRDIENLQIPLPPLEIQEKITKEVKSRLDKTEKLKKEANEKLKKAKQEIEEILLE